MPKNTTPKLTAILIITLIIAGTFSYVNHLINKPLKILKNYTIPTEFIHNDTKIALAWTDNNEGETLIIQSDKKEYNGFSSVDVYFSITNISEKDQDMDVVVWVGSEKVKVKNINKLNENQKTTSKEMVLSASTGVSAGIVNPNNSITDEKNLSSPNTLKDVEAPGIEPGRSGLTIPTSQPAAPTSDLLYNNSKLASNLDRKSVNGFEIGYFVNDNIESGNTNYYKATIKYPPMSKGEFFIEAFGEAEPLRFALANRRGSASYGHLDPWYSSNWNYKREITINASQISTTTDNFPVLATTTLDDLKTTANGGKVESDNGYDIIFVDDDDSTILNYEREYYASTTGEIVYWIKTDISSTTDKTIFMYYGNSSTADLATTTGVWDDNFVMVQHMQETDIDGGAGDIKDSTKYANHGTTTSMTTDNQVAGQIGGSLDFNGSNDYVTHNSISFGDAVPHTYSAWMRWDGGSKQVIPFGDAVSWFHGIDTSRFAGVKEFWYRTSVQARFIPGVDTTVLYDGGQRHITWTVTSGRIVTVYIDGTFNGGGYDIPETDMVYAGIARGTHVADYDWDGIIDEVRISDIARTAGWIETEYNNQSDVGSFMTFGSEVYNIPTITSVTDSPTPARRDSIITFSVDWNDDNSSNIKAKICKTDSLTNQNCDGGHYASSSVFTTDDPAEVTYAIQTDDTAGNYDYYAFVCDDDGNCSGSTHGTFAIGITQINTPHTNKWTDGLVGYWSFDGQDMDWSSSTAEALDRSGNSNNGDVKNGAKSAIGKVGQAMEFDGSDDYVDVPDADNLDVTSVTLSAWVKSDTAGGYIIAKDPPAPKLRRASLPEGGNYKDVFKEGFDNCNYNIDDENNYTNKNTSTDSEDVLVGSLVDGVPLPDKYYYNSISKNFVKFLGVDNCEDNFKQKKETSSCEKDSLSTDSANTAVTAMDFSAVNHLNNSIADENSLSSINNQSNKKAAPVDRTGFEPVFPQVINRGACQLAERLIKSGLLDDNYNIQDNFKQKIKKAVDFVKGGGRKVVAWFWGGADLQNSSDGLIVENSISNDKETPKKISYNTNVSNLEDGKQKYKIHVGHINYKDKETEQFEKIDTTLLSSDYGWEMNKASYHLEIPEYADDWFRFVNDFEDENYKDIFKEGLDNKETVAMKPLGVSRVKGELIEFDENGWNKKKILYKNAFGDNIDLEVVAKNIGFDKLIVINEKPKDLRKDLEFSFEIDLDDYVVKYRDGQEWDKQGLTESDQPFILEKLKQTWFREFSVWDSTDKRGRIRVRLEEDGGKYIFTKILDKEFLENAVYPVYTDDTVSYYAGAGDGYVYHSSLFWNTVHDAVDGLAYSAPNVV